MFLVVADIPIPVQASSASELEPEVQGADTRAFSGRLNSTVQWEKRNWRFTSRHTTQAFYNSVRAAVAGGAQVVCSGDALDGENIVCRVTIGERQFVSVRGGFRRVFTLTLREV